MCRSSFTKLFEAKKHHNQVGFYFSILFLHLKVDFPKVGGLLSILSSLSSSFSLSTLYLTFLLDLCQKSDFSYNRVFLGVVALFPNSFMPAAPFP